MKSQMGMKMRRKKRKKRKRKMQWKKMRESTMQERTTDALRKNPKTVALEFANALESTTSLLTSAEGDLPSIVTVAVTVPLESLRFLSSTSLDKIGTPGLHLVVYNGQLFENSFSSLYLHFGKLSVNPDEKQQILMKIRWVGAVFPT